MGQALPKECCFVGREREFAELEEWLGFYRQKPLQKSVITLWGLSGIGKSQLVSEFVKIQRHKYPSYSIFWLMGESKEAFEQSIINACKVVDRPTPTSLEASEGYQAQRERLINSFFTELQSPTRARWLIVVDGVSGISSSQQPIRSYLDRLACGSFILTARSKDVAEWYHRRIEIIGLPEKDAVKLLKLEIDDPFRGNDEGKTTLANGIYATDVVSRCV